MIRIQLPEFTVNDIKVLIWKVSETQRHPPALINNKEISYIVQRSSETLNYTLAIHFFVVYYHDIEYVLPRVREYIKQIKRAYKRTVSCSEPNTKLELGNCSPQHLIDVFFFIYLLEGCNKITSLYLSQLQLPIASPVAVVEDSEDHCFSWKNKQIPTPTISTCRSQPGHPTRHIHAKVGKLILDKFRGVTKKFQPMMCQQELPQNRSQIILVTPQQIHKPSGPYS